MTDTEKRIRDRMTAMGVSENALADRTAIARPTLRRRLANPKSMSHDEAERLADALEVSAVWLLFGVEAA